VKNSGFKTAIYFGLGRIAPADDYDGEDGKWFLGPGQPTFGFLP
jgi:hypothetical protein